jgi:hypothetical protein
MTIDEEFPVRGIVQSTQKINQSRFPSPDVQKDSEKR